jgi:L-histidine N-alpha-methyltransferase
VSPPATVEVEVLVGPQQRRRTMVDEARAGLGGRPRSIPPVWFYDETGSDLFEQITRLPEYYLTRAERAILGERAAEVVGEARAETLVEIGSGTSEKTRLLLDAMAAAGRLRQIVLLDISEEVLRRAAGDLCRRYGVGVHAVVGDFRSHLGCLPRTRRQLWAFLGSTIGNFEPASRARLLGDFAGAMAVGDHLLLGTDLVKDPGRLLAAYDDRAGVTARFNLNVLSVLNRELGGDFDPSSFAHRAFWDAGQKWIEMRLRSLRPQAVQLAGLELSFALDEGEEIRTEISAKFDPAEVPGELAGAGLDPLDGWTDPGGDFLLSLCRR